MKKLLFTLILGCTLAYTSLAQTTVPQADVATVEAIVNAGLKIISGPKDQPRDMEKFKALFLPGAQMGGVFFKGDSSFVRITTVENFADKNGPAYAKMGFYENQISLKVEQFGNIATAFQAYETRYGKDGKVEDRGINTYQLVFDKGRWWIASLLFTPENVKHPLPKKYLK
ncbi:hypothetical protein ABID22_000047 [Pontibacter aydingkolensis]|uniref:DUF4440 domain-containing protein n=1 Tax=Pontibacter aydingkolensis TaxID=1911536 RepID=A0ABS7CR39_9BACT|nr:hypothetical protein [Pontibacter aydingkolensis]MBW7466279.1 hypothetical protein [Pontibacter aydingkolensis]